MFTLYTRTNCLFCRQAKDLLRQKHLSFNEMIIDHDITREEVIEKFPNRKVLPIILVDDVVVGGYTDLQARLS